MKTTTRHIWHWLIGILFIATGSNHFINPKPYIAMMPAYLPAPELLVQISGIAEALGGLGVLFRFSRRFAAWGLILLLIAVFPANLYVALYGWPGENIPTWLLWARLPFQPLAIWWVYRVYLKPPKL